ncbi:retropepsin-like aspartic protease family protein [Sphingomonas lenta]|uniref:TIGR02281 family clan AA aspartic protease n=1 Tax=Sphingomonas lenta TaxID=1141887 RepID=A0A2A2SK30_9SPHN|nr:retropepsin-like aspartic protease [Sphingomonas lenta]PAX09592.1 TIGR02281 family clan AA aspartic protease [Sphingomonas lenta]
MNDTAQFLALALMLLLPLSALIARRPPLGQTVKFALAWIAVFAVGLLLVSQFDRLPSLRTLLYDQQVVGQETRIRMSEDGHFYADVSINGVERRMLIDSGATITALSQETARAAGIDTESAMFPVALDTANGVVEAKRGRAETVRVGSISTRDLGVVVSPAFGETDVLGMNFLSRLGSWRVERRSLILTPSNQE